MSSPIRVGAVSYLNAKPLYYRLCDFAPEIQLSMDVPSRLADRLAAGELDVALDPVGGVPPRRPSRLRDPAGVRDRGAGAGAERQAVQPGAVRADRAAGARRGLADEPGAGAGLARRRARGPARGGSSRCRWGCSVAGEHGRRGARDRRPGDEGARTSRSTRWSTWPRPGSELTGLPFVFALWVVRGRGRPRRPARGPGAEPGRGAGPRRRAGPDRTGPRLGLDVATCYDYLTRVSVVRPRRAGDRRPEPVRPDGGRAGPGPGRSEPCLPPSPRSCSAPLTAAA